MSVSKKKLQDECKSLESEMTDLESKLKRNREKVNQLFVTSKLVQKKLQKCQDINQDIASKSRINIYKFEPSNDLTALQMKDSPIGKLSTEVKTFAGPHRKSMIEMKTAYVEKVKVQAAKEGKCWITGMAMITPDEILLADANNTSLKIIDVSKGNITKTYKLPCGPLDVTVINADAVATTLPDQGKILFLNTKNGLSESHSLKVRYGCLGIDHHNGIMAVSFGQPPAVQILDMKGHILHEVSDTSIFKWPYYISLSNANESMFVSDCENHALYELTIDGHLEAMIKSEILKKSTGLAVISDGTVVVCGPNSGRVSMIVPGTREVLPLYIQNVQAQASILIWEDQNKLYISEHKSSNDSNFMKIFDLK